MEEQQEFVSKLQVDPDRVTELARALVRTPSHTPDGEIQAAERVQRFLRQEGIAAECQPVEDVGVNLVATLPGASSDIALLLNGHLDTVPPSSAMTLPPFEGLIENGQLWGRGSADMKGGFAAMICALAAVHASGIPLKHSIMLAGVACEEKGNRGTAALIRQGIRARWAVIGEATGLDLVIAHKGVDRYQVIVEGRAARESMPERGINAIISAGHVIAALDKNLFPKACEQTHPFLGHATFNIGTIQGGINRNSIPDRCIFQISKRWLPGDSPEAIRAELDAAIRAANPEARVSLVREADMERIPHPPLDIAPTHRLPRQLGEVIARIAGRAPRLLAWPAFTDAALLQDAGIPALIFGPGDLALAHADDEHLPVEEMVTAARVYAAFALIAAQE